MYSLKTVLEWWFSMMLQQWFIRSPNAPKQTWKNWKKTSTDWDRVVALISKKVLADNKTVVAHSLCVAYTFIRDSWSSNSLFFNPMDINTFISEFELFNGNFSKSKFHVLWVNWYFKLTVELQLGLRAATELYEKAEEGNNTSNRIFFLTGWK